MAFKLKPINEVLKLDPASKNGELIKYTDNMPDNVAGYVDMNKTIFINDNMSKAMKRKALKHEKVHIDQIKKGRFAFDDNNYVFDGKVYDIDKLDSYTEHGPTDFKRYRLECWIKWKDFLQTPGNRWNDKVEKERRLSTVMAVFDVE